ncbi:hypothetical protein GQ473_07355 [archaeon]|nr:hypothetical protein [archaeon]
MDNRIDVNGKVIHIKHCRYYARLSLAHYKRIIFDSLEQIGIESKYIDLQFGGGSGLRDSSWAELTWIVNGIEHKYRCDSQQCDVDNVASISQVIAQDIKSIRRGLKSFGQVMNQFQIEAPTGKREKTSREIIGVEASCMDIDYILFKYKQRAKKIHPDKTGNQEEMQRLNDALAELDKELR